MRNIFYQMNILIFLDLVGSYVFYLLHLHMGFPVGSVIKEAACNAGDVGLISGLGRSPVKEKATHSRFWPRKSNGQRHPAGYSPWGCKELDVTWQPNNKEKQNKT